MANDIQKTWDGVVSEVRDKIGKLVVSPFAILSDAFGGRLDWPTLKSAWTPQAAAAPPPALGQQPAPSQPQPPEKWPGPDLGVQSEGLAKMFAGVVEEAESERRSQAQRAVVSQQNIAEAEKLEGEANVLKAKAASLRDEAASAVTGYGEIF